MRVFFGTNVFVSAFAARGLCADLLQIVLADHQLVVGGAVLGELRPTLRRKLRMAPALVDQVEAFVRSQAEVVAEAPLPIVAPRAFWELLKAGPRGSSGGS